MPYYLHTPGISARAIELSRMRYVWPPSYEFTDDTPAEPTEEQRDDAWPYYSDGRGQEIVDSPLALAHFDTAAEAHNARKALASNAVVTFVPTTEQREDWRYRELRKVERPASTGCQRLPWAHEAWQAELNRLHHAYLSAEKPGLLAYTPSEEWGVADRQLRVRPGKYLEQFAPHLTQQERDHYCAQVKAIDDRNVVHFTSSPDTIEKVYQLGPDSCMSKRPSSYCSDGVHPTRIYGDSPDLQLAYLGDLDERTIRARVMVWPSRLIYSRIYGDETIGYLLKQQGYSKGSLAGARVRAVECDNDSDVYIMPYVDGIESARLDSTCDYLIFQETDDGYYCQNTTGVTDNNYSREQENETNCCAHCDTEIDSDSVYCESCDESRYECGHCNRELFDRDRAADDIGDYDHVCQRCVRSYAACCAECDNRYLSTPGYFGTQQQRDRIAYDLYQYCPDCLDTQVTERKEAEQRAIVLASIAYALTACWSLQQRDARLECR